MALVGYRGTNRSQSLGHRRLFDRGVRAMDTQGAVQIGRRLVATPSKASPRTPRLIAPTDVLFDSVEA